MIKKAEISFLMACVLYYICLFMNARIYIEAVQIVLLIFVFCFVYQAFFYKEKNRFFKLSGFLFCVGFLIRIATSVFLEMSSLLNIRFYYKMNENILICLYIMTNICLIMALGIYGYLETKRWDRMQFILDNFVLSLSLLLCIWIFIFEDHRAFWEMIYSNPMLFFCAILDVILLTCNFIWLISMRKEWIQISMIFILIGSSIYACADFWGYYLDFESDVSSGKIVKAFAELGFIFLGIGAVLKIKSNVRIPKKIKMKTSSRLWKGLIIAVVPFSVFFLERSHPISNSTELLLLLLVLYFFFSEYIQMKINRDEKQNIERQNIIALENKVEERTKELMLLNHTDEVTKLFNRRFFDELLEDMCEKCKDCEECLTLYYIEINKQTNFKSFYGRDTAEKIMIEIAKILKTVIDERIQVLASYGESVFVIATKHLCSISVELEYAKKIIAICSKSYQVNNHDITVSLNIGISCFPHQAKTAEELLTDAELALIQSKEEGNNQVLLYNERIGQHLNKKNQLEMLLKQVEFKEEFQLYYQPQVNATTGELIGFESLIRWFSKARGLISPLEFIPTAEETGVIVPLGYFIMEEAAKQLALWKKMTEKRITMAVNVSSKQLSDKDFSIHLSTILNKYAIRPEDFEIEITENVSLGENEIVQENLAYTEMMGVPIAIDDFGTGYSSLIYLKNLNIHRIKIAKELIDNIENDSYDRTIIQMVILIAKEKKIHVIAEGVETKEQWECLKSIGCNEIQGYYFSRPLPAIDAEETWVKKHETGETE